MTQTRSQTAQRELSQAQEIVWVEVGILEDLRRRSFGEQQGEQSPEEPRVTVVVIPNLRRLGLHQSHCRVRLPTSQLEWEIDQKIKVRDQ
ncbi:unnamed protein product [Calypogeia fissa]